MGGGVAYDLVNVCICPVSEGDIGEFHEEATLFDIGYDE
jgi:hypothetical protein